MNPLKKYVDGAVEFDISEFITPPKETAPVYSWNWNGKISKENISRQIDEMTEAGIRSFYVIPLPKEFRPATMATALEPEYLSEAFFDFILFAKNYAMQKGITVWLYDEGGFPSGMACGRVAKKNPKTASKSLASWKFSVHAGKSFDEEKNFSLSDGEEIVALFDGNNRISGDDVLENDTEITVFSTAKNYSPGLNGTKVSLNTDILEKETTDVFIELTHEQYKSCLGDTFGDTVPCMFTDEPGLVGIPWTNELREEFIKAYNYDILDFLPVLFSTDDGEQNEKIRIQYRTLVYKLLKKNYFEKIHDWCKSNGVYATGHLDVDNSIQGATVKGYGNQLGILREFDIPGIDVIWRQIYRRKDGPVMLGGYANHITDNAFFPRMPASAANQSGHNLALSESFAVYGNGVTFDDMRYACNYQYIRGINLFNMMSISYGRKGSLPFSLPHPLLQKEIPGYANLRLVNEYLNRMSYVTSVGRRDADVALVIPVADVMAGGERAKSATEAFENCGQGLERSGIDFDVIDEEAIKKAKLVGNELHIGRAVYKHIVVPEGITIDSRTEGILKNVGISPEPVLSAGCGFDSLRVMRRKTEAATLYYIFNEDAKPVRTVLTFNEKRPIYRLYCESGNVETSSPNPDIELASGEIAVFIATEKEIPAAQPFAFSSCKNKAEIKDFSARRVSKTVLDESGMSKKLILDPPTKTSLGKWKYGRDFSGEVSYSATFNVTLANNNAKKAYLSIGNLYWSARVKINGKPVGICGFRPFGLAFDLSVLHNGKNEIEITVSNTAGNVFCAFRAKDYWENRYLSNYYDRQRQQESETLEGGLEGPVTVYY